MDTTYIKNHLEITKALYKSLKGYLECKNSGVYGGKLAKRANAILVSLKFEAIEIETVLEYCSHHQLQKPHYSEIIPMNYRYESDGVLTNMKKDIYRFLAIYERFTQSSNVGAIKVLLEELK